MKQPIVFFTRVALLVVFGTSGVLGFPPDTVLIRDLVEIKGRALELKRQGEAADQAGQQITTEFKQKYPGWNIDNLIGFTKAAYSE